MKCKLRDRITLMLMNPTEIGYWKMKNEMKLRNNIKWGNLDYVGYGNEICQSPVTLFFPSRKEFPLKAYIQTGASLHIQRGNFVSDA